MPRTIPSHATGRPAAPARAVPRLARLAVTAGAVLAAGLLAACGQDNLARCVDGSTSQLVDVSRCDSEAADGTGGRYLWNFGGSSDTQIGSRVDGGENVDPADQAAISQRGGFEANAPTSGTGVRELASEEAGDGKKKKKSKGFGGGRRR